MKSIKCILGFHKGPIIMIERTREFDPVAGVPLRRNVHICNRCNKTYYKRTDGLFMVNNDEKWDWYRIF